MADEKYEPPKESLGDRTAALIRRGGLGAIPSLGQFAIELCETVFTPAMERRTGEWMNEIAEGLRQLEKDFDELKDDNSFIDIAMQASQAALRTTQKEKREALRNAVLNSALPDPPAEALRQVFVGLVDDFSGLHVRILGFLNDPQAWYEEQGEQPPHKPPQTLWALVRHAMPDLEAQQTVCEHICRDLNSRQLLIARSINDPVSHYPYFPGQPRHEQVGYSSANPLPGIGTTQYVGQPSAVREWTTDLGRQFLTFIASPIKD